VRRSDVPAHRFGIRTQIADSAGTTTWGYDALDRLTSASYPSGDAVSYGYDAVGNRTSLTVNGSTTTNNRDVSRANHEPRT
jgi:YD repeat-containing protein